MPKYVIEVEFTTEDSIDDSTLARIEADMSVQLESLNDGTYSDELGVNVNYSGVKTHSKEIMTLCWKCRDVYCSGKHEKEDT